MIGYIARDANGELYLHKELPEYEDNGVYKGWFSSCDELNITNEYPEFDNLQCTDKPIKVEINIKRV